MRISSPRIRATLAAVVSLAAVPTVAHAQVFSGPLPYLSVLDSPFGAISFSSFYVETFEDGLLNTPGVTLAGAAPAIAAPGPFNDSVDGDDGVIDGFGTAGYSLYSATRSSFLFQFAAGALPTHAGIVWTDVGFVFSGTLGVGGVTFEAFGPGGASLGIIGPVTLGDGNAAGGTAEDRFFGAFNAAGISAIQISMNNSTDWEVDHLQYGIAPTAVPEPVTSVLLLSGLGLIAGVRARRRR